MKAAAKVGTQKVAPAQNAFAGLTKKPAEEAVASVLGKSCELWRRLIAELMHELALDKAEWHSGSIKYGWSIRLQKKKRNIVYLGPREGCFVACFALGDRAVTAARKSALPAHVIRSIAESRRYAEGTAVRIEVKEPNDLEAVKALARIKIEN